MASTSRRQQSYYTTAAPIPTPQKASTHSYSYAPLSRVSVSASPPEHISANSSTAGSRTSGGTYSTPSGTGYVSSYPSAAGYVGGYGGNYEYDHSSASGNGVDVVDMLSERMNTAFEFAPTRMDEGLVRQAQTSGQLNAKHRELLELQARAQRRLKSSRANFEDGVKAAKEVKRDLEWTQRKVTSLKSKAERKDPERLRRAERKYRDDEY